ncbi:hypothetical protein RvY_10478 [Ramazzottius varieornatus]|uniref:Uncharacterized protein n=1 Tax=Ramazzottius varieornatus TaxID=947166 RepID=A0A1D1VCX4_RAMVA|nr:hypothetical protein RvY_10478 [Ramazzottius varieornatus]
MDAHVGFRQRLIESDSFVECFTPWKVRSSFAVMSAGARTAMQMRVVINIFLMILFAGCSLVQANDPDPELWMVSQNETFLSSKKRQTDSSRSFSKVAHVLSNINLKLAPLGKTIWLSLFADLPFGTILQEVTFWFSQPVYIAPCILCAIDMLSSWTFGIRGINSRTSSGNPKSLKRMCYYRDYNALSPFVFALCLLCESWGGHGVPLGQRNDLHVPRLLE